jgi:transposase
MEAETLRIKRDSGQWTLCRARDNAHARRKYFEIYDSTASPIAFEALERIGALYEIEDEIRGKLPDERKVVRQARAAPLLQELYDWLHATVRKVSKKSPIASAIGYTLSLWTALTRYAEDGSIEVDNNPVERALRVVALGRKNYLFAGSDAGGERAAAFYSLIGTALCRMRHSAVNAELRTMPRESLVMRWVSRK